jgi:hypothetical protein
MKPFLTIVFILASFTSDIKTENFAKQWGEGIAVVQYNAVFNKTNSVKNLTRLSDARVFNAWIDEHPKLKEIGRVKSVPTVVLYKDGEEIRRWEAGISMKLELSYRDVQTYVDELTGANQY